jgi:hypothetical protein
MSVQSTARSVASFRMQLHNGEYSILLARVDGHDIPEEKQRPVYRNASLSRAQAILHALNGDLIANIALATRIERVRVQDLGES